MASTMDPLCHFTIAPALSLFPRSHAPESVKVFIAERHLARGIRRAVMLCTYKLHRRMPIPPYLTSLFFLDFVGWNRRACRPPRNTRFGLGAPYSTRKTAKKRILSQPPARGNQIHPLTFFWLGVTSPSRRSLRKSFFRLYSVAGQPNDNF